MAQIIDLDEARRSRAIAAQPRSDFLSHDMQEIMEDHYRCSACDYRVTGLLEAIAADWQYCPKRN